MTGAAEPAAGGALQLGHGPPEHAVQLIGEALARGEVPATEARAEDEAGRLMALETRLAAAHWDRVRCRDVLATYNLTTLDDLRAAAPAFDWAGWIAALGGAEEQFAEAVVRQPSFLPALSEALADVPLDDWKIWLTFHLIRRAAGACRRDDESAAVSLLAVVHRKMNESRGIPRAKPHRRTSSDQRGTDPDRSVASRRPSIARGAGPCRWRS